MDPITDLFLTTQAASVVHARLEATAPWGLKRDAYAVDGTAKDMAHPAISPSQLAHSGMVTRGQCWLSVEGIADAVPLAGGDRFLLPPGSSYTLRDNPRTRPRSFCEVAPRNRSQVIEYGGGGAPTTVVSGWFQFEQTSVKILQRLLPLLIIVRAAQARSTACRFRSANRRGSEIHARECGKALDSRVAGRGLRYVSLRVCGEIQRAGRGDAARIPSIYLIPPSSNQLFILKSYYLLLI